MSLAPFFKVGYILVLNPIPFICYYFYQCIYSIHYYFCHNEGAVTAVLGMFPAEYLGTMGSGCGIGGLIPSVMNIAIIGASKNSAQLVGISCFCICTALAAFGLVFLFILNKNSFYQSYANGISSKEKEFNNKVMHIIFLRFY